MFAKLNYSVYHLVLCSEFRANPEVQTEGGRECLQWGLMVQMLTRGSQDRSTTWAHSSSKCKSRDQVLFPVHQSLSERKKQDISHTTH